MTEPNATLDLSPCPCCGYRAELEQVPHDPETPNSGGYYIECKRAGCGITTRLAFAAKDDPVPGLAQSWNRRTRSETALTSNSQDGGKAVASAARRPSDTEIQVCGAHAEGWFCGRNHLPAGFDHCIVCCYEEAWKRLASSERRNNAGLLALADRIEAAKEQPIVVSVRAAESIRALASAIPAPGDEAVTLLRDLLGFARRRIPTGGLPPQAARAIQFFARQGDNEYLALYEEHRAAIDAAIARTDSATTTK